VTWGLRDYQLPPTIWDSEPPDVCEGGRDHVWGDEKNISCGNAPSNKSTLTTNSGKGPLPGNKYESSQKQFSSQGQFCQVCQAWRGCLGLEPTPELFIKHMVEIFREVRRVLRKDGSLWLNMGDSYASGKGSCFNPGGGENSLKGHAKLKENKAYKLNRPNISDLDKMGLKPKDLCGIPWRLALALQADGWWLRSGIPWVKRSAMPESCSDRPASALEYVFLLTKSAKCFFDMDAIKKQSSPDSHRRYTRGRSNNHKWSDGGPGNQTIAKSMKHMIPGVTPKSAPAGSGIKANESFHAAIGDLVGSRNFRNIDLFFESLEPPFGAIFAGDELVGLDINPKGFAAAHFATFPPRLPEVAILAGTSEKGCCAECGAPWERVIDYKANYEKREIAHQPNNTLTKVDSTGWKPPTIKTTGWKPGCECFGPPLGVAEFHIGKKPIPCTVLDPFGGAMTTAIVAHKYNRKFIMIELSKKYIDEIGIPRIEKETRQLGLFN